MSKTERAKKRVAMSAPLSKLYKKIEKRTARIGIIGLGYVGLPLAVEFAREGFKVTGLDVDLKRVEGVRKARSYIIDISSDDLREVRRSNRLQATTSFEVLGAQDAI